MFTASLGGVDQPVRRILAIGAHSDDIEIGCGGTLMRLTRECPGVEVAWVVLSAQGERAVEARASAEAMLRGIDRYEIQLNEFRDGFLPYEGAAVKDCFERMKPISPDLVLTHYGGDAHQDHRLVSELTWNTFRDHLILEFEIPKYDGDLSRPNVFVRLDDDVACRKVRHLLEQFPSQRGKRWFSEDLFLSILRLRGMECNAPRGYAEAFHARKLVL
jgi:LmbE family N-acetylglucosaminyl deacetylase